jgi:hypothetical protein
MNKSVYVMINTVISAVDFFACGTTMSKIKYHDPGFEK